MKLKTWLLLSYFIVMILPLAAAYLLFAWINSYHNDQNVSEHLQTWTKVQPIISILDDPSLYQAREDRSHLEDLMDAQVSIFLYNDDGITLFSSSPIQQYVPNKEQLYEDLYKLNQGYRSYTYKQPVWNKNEIVGFFKVEIARDKWVEEVSSRSWITIGLFGVLFISIYSVVVYFVNRKLNKRLDYLRDQMTAFANDAFVEEIPLKKDEIGELTSHFYRMQQQIKAAREKIAKEQEEKAYMIAAISHDLKTPLTSIRAYAEALATEEKMSPIEREDYRNTIVEKANFMKQMLDDLLMYTLLQSPTYEMKRVEVDGNEFFEMLVSGYEPICQEKKIKLRTYSNVDGKYQVNPKQMIRVADNLMSNAIQHTKLDGHISIGAVSNDQELPSWLFPFVQKYCDFTHKDCVYLIVQNEGVGIEREKWNHIFDALYQADQARSKKDARGTGLGLSITKQIVEKHGGEVNFLSEINIGTCVVCKLPKKEVMDDEK